jgi:hypothetical protein
MAESHQAGPEQQAARADTGAQVTGAVPGAQALTIYLYNAQGNELGDVERVVEGPDGKQYIVIGAGGFLGIGEKHVPIPLDRVAVRGDRLVTQGLTEDQIRSMQTVDRNERRFRELDRNQQIQINAVVKPNQREAGASPLSLCLDTQNVKRCHRTRHSARLGSRTSVGQVSSRGDCGLAGGPLAPTPRANVPRTSPVGNLAAEPVIVGAPARIVRNWLSAHGPVLAMNQVGQQITGRTR